ncbi:MAG TPA: flavodoxin [Balneolaceae bacterium]|nr:flavodoxin [Balneolaceae bacterium]
MRNFAIIYASMSGNTEAMVRYIVQGMREKGATVDVTDIFELTEGTLGLEKYDGILIGTYTWMDGDVPDEFLSFFESLPNRDLRGQKAAVFGSYESFYGNEGAAIDLFTDALKTAGAEVVLPPLKIELSPEPDEVINCIAYGKKFVSKFDESIRSSRKKSFHLS